MLLNNRFEILEQLGQGGFGTTFLAADTHMPSQRRCVVKQLRPETPNQQSYQMALQKFQEEAATLEQLNHDQIPKLYAYFEQDGLFYLVQEWIQGQTLGVRVRQAGPLPEADVLQMMTQLLPVLDYLHHHAPREVIHRDVKPENIILRQSDQKPVLIDFGAVKQLLKTVVSSSGNVTCSVVIGSGGFMPPEQAAQRVVYSSDLYSLGVTAIFALTGRLLGDLEKDSRTSELLWQQYAPQVSPAMAAVLTRVTQLDPRDRYSTAHEMLQALQGLTPVSPTLISPAAPQAAVTVFDAFSGSSHQPFGGSPSEASISSVTSSIRPRRPLNAAAIAAGLVALFAASALGASVVIMAQEDRGKDQGKEESTALLKDARSLAMNGKYQAAIDAAAQVPSDDQKLHAKAEQSIEVWEALQTAEKLAGEGKKGDAIATLLKDIPANAANAEPAWEKVAQWSAVDLGSSMDQVLKPLNVPNAKRKLANLDARRRADVEPKTAAKPIQTQLGSSPIKTWTKNWPQDDQPTSADLKSDPKSWGDPWRESYAFASDKMAVNVLYGCTTNVIIQTEVQLDPSLSLDLMKTQLDQMLAGQSTPSIISQLEKARRGEAVDATFNTGDLRGVIRRTAQNRVQIRVRKA
ncbi:Serine/threonine-protein kinase C [Acaryochloris thomasi RCC1774]|uniref:non-specific serine/threonine protein kinase n=1 Tax=Acaryochloris thomasi RCC1774 TaxID=1764569 RepID=A0A2W1JL56_9CYAN|nr:serine/threonine-protein kinase [Acaryochloris thomasi]PZD74098.1 Serine/threonine-protein kinase C [Acaryochloris thomasi RCC1774]